MGPLERHGCGALLYHGVRWSSEASGAPRWRETASGFGLNQWQSVEKCGLSRSSWIQVGVFDKKSAEVFRASWLATEAVGSLGMQRSHFCKSKIGPLQIRAISLGSNVRGALDQHPGLGQIRMVENRATTGGRLVPTYTQKAHWTRNSINPPPPRLAAARRRSARTAGRSRTTAARAASRGPRRRR